mmetsp:Transcript_40749/g.101335  ORF Transcript_40749/g.101335 Transcript_40749/m.101335 type:complete len:329 (-) Transcript_40749:221-1207(-)
MLALTLYATVLSRRVVTPTTRDASISTSFSTPIVHWNSTTCLRPDLVVASKGLLHPAQHLSLPRHGRRLLRKLRTRITASCLAHIDLFRDAGAAASRRARAAWHTFCSSWARRAFVLARLVLVPAKVAWRRVTSRGLLREFARKPHERAVRGVRKQAPTWSDRGEIKLSVNVEFDRHSQAAMGIQSPVGPVRTQRTPTSRHLGRESRTHAVVHAVQGLLQTIFRRLQLVLHKACVRPLLRAIGPVVRTVKGILRPLRLLRWFKRIRCWCRRGLNALRASWCKQIFVYTLRVLTVVSALLVLCAMLFSRGSRLPHIYYRSRREAGGVPC